MVWFFTNILIIFTNTKEFFLERMLGLVKFSLSFKLLNWNLINFFKEGMLIDCLQKKSFDSFVKKFLIESTHFFNLNYLTFLFVKFWITEVYWKLNIYLFKSEEISLGSIFSNIINLLFYLCLLIIFVIFFS